VEAGGTKFVCAIGDSDGHIRQRAQFSTTTPDETLRETVTFFRAAQSRHGQLDAIGIASFGPLDLHRSSPTFGWITSTPKPGWANVDIVGALTRAFDVPIDVDTDVNAAALGEWRWGAAQTLDTFIYLTIGTGIGGGGLVNGQLMHGLVHPEMGHVRIPHDVAADPFAGICPFHGDCLEGLASGPAIAARWGLSGESIPDDHPAWMLEARYLALAISNFVCTISPQRVIIGGGVMAKTHLYHLIKQHVLESLNNYVRAPRILESIDDYIVPPSLSNDVGVLGALALADRNLIAQK
jgi:fructokinase